MLIWWLEVRKSAKEAKGAFLSGDETLRSCDRGKKIIVATPLLPQLHAMFVIYSIFGAFTFHVEFLYSYFDHLWSQLAF